MSPSPLTLAVAAVMFLAITAYALLAGADFGGGIWDLLAGGTERGSAPREFIDESVTPVWEANHVWLVLMLVVLWSAFPPAFAAIMTALFIPLNLSLLGIFFRGVGFAFRHTAQRVRAQQVYGVLFAASSLMTPFFLGTVAGAIATGAVRADAHGNDLAAWTSLTALLSGGLAVAACAFIAAVYLVRDAIRAGRPDLARYFGRRAFASGAVGGGLAVATLVAMRSDGRYVYDRLLGPALPLVIVSVVAGAAALLVIVLRRTRLLRPLAGLTVAAALWGWAFAQYPWLLPTSLSLADGAAPNGTLVTEVVAAAMVALLVVPGFVLLFVLQQRGLLRETSSADELRAAVAAEQGQPRPSERPASMGERVAAAAVVSAAAVRLIRRRGRGDG